ncbi:MAG: hypothetical protein AAF733_03270, partial [Verrucomicrobiota bacterium]
MKPLFENYETESFFDEAFDRDSASFRASYAKTAEFFEELTPDRMQASLRSLERSFLKQGVT